jgi:hypothetical protein
MPLIMDLTKNADINPVHMGAVIITTLAFGLITPLRAVLVDGGEIRRHQIFARHGGVAADLHRVLRSYCIYHLLPGPGAVAAEETVAAIGRLLPESKRSGIRLSLRISDRVIGAPA